MTTTHLYFDGGTRHGKTERIDGLTPDLSLQYGGLFDAEETYDSTEETIEVDGIIHTVYRLRTT